MNKKITANNKKNATIRFDIDIDTGFGWWNDKYDHGTLVESLSVVFLLILVDHNSNNNNDYNPNGFDTKITDGLDEVAALYKSITKRRGIVGALQNQLESALNTNRDYELNLVASSSTIKDVDYAVATSRVTSAQISFDASYSSLVQASSLSSDILGLL